MATRPKKVSPPSYGPAVPSQVNQPQPPGGGPTNPYDAFHDLTHALTQTVPYNVNRAQAATKRIRLLGR